MVRAVVLIAVFFGLVLGSVFSAEFKALVWIAGLFGICVGLDWVTRKHES